MSSLNYRFLVVGADGLVGSALVASLERRGADVIGTSRRKGRLGANRFFLDLADEASVDVVEKGSFSCAFLCAGITNMIMCEAKHGYSRQINVINTLNLARRLRASGARVVFLSSNTVFNGKALRPSEEADHCPSTEYGRQKVEVEQELLSSGDAESVSIVRLSKVLSPVSGMAAEFIKQLTLGEPCMAFNDLWMSPISLDCVTRALLALAAGKYSGVFHLSGSDEITYAEFAHRLAAHIGADPTLVRPISSIEGGVEVLFRPDHPALGMKRTTALLGIQPETIEHVMDQLVERQS